MFVNGDYDMYLESLMESNYKESDKICNCDKCGEDIYDTENFFEISGETYCEFCKDNISGFDFDNENTIEICEECGSEIYSGEYFTKINGEYYCEECMSKNHFKLCI